MRYLLVLLVFVLFSCEKENVNPLNFFEKENIKKESNVLNQFAIPKEISSDGTQGKDVLGLIVKYISETKGKEEDEIKGESSFTQDLGFDELEWLEFIMFLEDEFELEITDELVEEIKTVNDAVAVVQGRMIKPVDVKYHRPFFDNNDYTHDYYNDDYYDDDYYTGGHILPESKVNYEFVYISGQGKLESYDEIWEEDGFSWEEDDKFPSEESSNNFRFTKIKYIYEFNKIPVKTPNGVITRVHLYDPSVHPGNETIIHNTYGKATRDIRIHSLSKSGIQTSNNSARLTWSFSVNFRYSFSDPNRSTIFRTIHKTYSMDISI